MKISNYGACTMSRQLRGFKWISKNFIKLICIFCPFTVVEGTKTKDHDAGGGDVKAAGGPERTIGLLAAINIIIGVIIGSGVFVTPTAALRYSGSVGFTLIVWAACGVISLMGALCFAELGTVIQRSGGEYAYLLGTYSGFHKFWGPLPAFLCSWLYVMVLRPAGCAVIIMTCAEYAIQPFASMLNLHNLDEDSQRSLVKIVALLFLGE